MQTEPTRVLLIENDGDAAAMLASYLADGAGPGGTFVLTQAPRMSTARILLARQGFDALLMDIDSPQHNGLEAFLKLRAVNPDIPTIILTGMRDEELAVQAVKLGAQDYLLKGSPECCLLKRAIRYAIAAKGLSREVDKLRGSGAAAAPDSRPLPEPASQEGLRAEIREGLRAVEVKNRFMTRISHELRNTLATIKTAAYCLKGGVVGDLAPRQARLVEIISRNVDRQERIIDNVLDLAHFRSGKFNIQLRSMDLKAIISEVVDDFETANDARKLHVDIDGPLPAVNADPDLIAQVLRNLIGNALRHAKEEVRIKASRTGDDGVSASVIDDGPGIPTERIRDLFDEFVQLSRPAGADGHRGTGLGLAICKEIIAGHHGEILADNEPGRGAHFRFSLPPNVPAPAAAGHNGERR